MMIKKNKNTKDNLDKIKQEILNEIRTIDLIELKIAFGNILKRTSTK